MTKKIDLGELELLKENEGGENVYHCNECGKPKLYVNTQTGAWFCFVCREGGSTSVTLHREAKPQEEFTHPLISWYANQSINSGPTGSDYLRELGPRAQFSPPYTKKYSTISKVKHRTTLDGTIVVPLRDTNESLTGIHCYSPNSTPTKYFTHLIPMREKGICSVTTGPLELMHFPAVTNHILVFEGLWDFLNTALCLDTIEATGVKLVKPVSLVFLAGNEPTSKQVMQIAYMANKSTIIHIMFDEDLVKPAIELTERLHLFTDAQRIVQHVPLGCKDWDEVYKTDPQVGMAEIQRILRIN